MKKLSLLMILSLVVAGNVMAGPSILERTRNRFRSEADHRAFYGTSDAGYTCMQLLTTAMNDQVFSSIADFISYFDAFDKCAKQHPDHAFAGALMNAPLLQISGGFKELQKRGLISKEDINKKHQ